MQLYDIAFIFCNGFTLPILIKGEKKDLLYPYYTAMFTYINVFITLPNTPNSDAVVSNC